MFVTAVEGDGSHSVSRELALDASDVEPSHGDVAMTGGAGHEDSTRRRPDCTLAALALDDLGVALRPHHGSE